MAASSRSLICVVDDDESVRTAIELLVASLGYATRGFSSAEAFLRAPEIANTACLILDVQLPRMSGTELHALLLQRALRIPIVFITAHRDAELEARFFEHAPICLLIKPFTPAALVRCIRSALKQR
jgi:FixJ family two-component response regulator